MPIHPVYGEYKSGWKVIPNFPNYQVNEFSEVRNIETKKILKYDPNFQVRLVEGKEKYNRFIYHLCLLTFFPHVERNGRTVDHIAELDRSNNHIENLQWLTMKEQLKKSNQLQPRKNGAKMSKAIEQWSLDGKTKMAEFVSCKAAEKDFKSRNISIASANISACASGKRKMCTGFVWKYKNNTIQENVEGEEFKSSEKLKKILRSIKIQGKPLTKLSISKIKVSNKGRILTSKGIKTKGNIQTAQKKLRIFNNVLVSNLIWAVFGSREPRIANDGEKEFVCHDLSQPLDNEGCFSNAIEHLRLDTRKNMATEEHKFRKSKSVLKKRKHAEIENN